MSKRVYDDSDDDLTDDEKYEDNSDDMHTLWTGYTPREFEADPTAPCINNCLFKCDMLSIENQVLLKLFPGCVIRARKLHSAVLGFSMPIDRSDPTKLSKITATFGYNSVDLAAVQCLEMAQQACEYLDMHIRNRLALHNLPPFPEDIPIFSNIRSTNFVANIVFPFVVDLAMLSQGPRYLGEVLTEDPSYPAHIIRRQCTFEGCRKDHELTFTVYKDKMNIANGQSYDELHHYTRLYFDEFRKYLLTPEREHEYKLEAEKKKRLKKMKSDPAVMLAEFLEQTDVASI